MDNVTVTISIGRGIGDSPMSARKWREFRADVRGALHSAGGTLYVDSAKSIGEWEGVREESATFVAGDIPADNVPALMDHMREFCERYDQDAIAFTVGETYLVRV